MMLQTARSIVFAVLALLTVVGKTAQAETFICENGLFFLGSTDVVDDVLILDGGVLLIDGATVIGDIEIEKGGALAASRATIWGDVESENALLVEVSFCDIAGSVELKRTGGSGTVFGLLPSITVIGCDVGGSVKISRSNVNSINVSRNIIGGKLELTKNRSTLPIIVENNVVRRRKGCD